MTAIDNMVDAAAKVLYNELAVKEGAQAGPWEGRDPDELIVVQLKATAKAMLAASGPELQTVFKMLWEMEASRQRCFDMLGDVPGDTSEERLSKFVGYYLELQKYVEELKTPHVWKKLADGMPDTERQRMFFVGNSEGGRMDYVFVWPFGGKAAFWIKKGDGTNRVLTGYKPDVWCPGPPDIPGSWVARLHATGEPHADRG